jgi:hypothetical protein
LKHITKLDDAEFVLFEESEQAQTGAVGEALHAGQEAVGLGRGSNHRFIRMDC